jgi:ribosomal protein S18 acetylase RimI-like enzyme
VSNNPKGKTSDMSKKITYLNIVFKIANTNLEFDDGRNLFQQYATSLNIELYFQDFSLELINIDKQYNRPKGALLLAYENNIAIGCAAIREFDLNTAELKRIFIQTKYKGYNIDMKLLELALDIAEELNYNKIRLETRPTMTQAQRSRYLALGFYKIPPDLFNPIEETIIMEKELS